MEDLKEYNHSAYEAISNLIEVDKYHDFNTRIPFYEEIILERGDAAAIAWISDRLDEICSGSSAITAYVNIHGFYKNKHAFVKNAASPKAAFVDLREFCRKRAAIDVNNEDKWKRLESRVNEIIAFIDEVSTNRKEFTITFKDSKEAYDCDVLLEQMNVDLDGGICEILRQVCRYYSETHGGKIVFNYKKKEE